MAFTSVVLAVHFAFVNAVVAATTASATGEGQAIFA